MVTLKELNSELLCQNLYSTIQNVDLSILTRCLQPQECLEEPDNVWEWDKIFTELTAEIHCEKPSRVIKKVEIGPDELPPKIQT